MPASSSRRARRIGLLLIGNVALAAGLLALIEGLSSLAFGVRDIYRQSGLAERRHTDYDPELGWVNRPNVGLEDFYGPGRPFHTNARGFRGTEDVDEAVAPGRRRIICSGDSFTLGYGVGDRDTWCHRLADADPRLETVNMGQGGYGIDQAFLWFRRDAADLERHLHLFAVITDDVMRMQSDHFLGYGKPVLKLESGSLAVGNVPVPRWPYRLPFLTRNLPLLAQLRVVQLFNELRSGPAEKPALALREQRKRDAESSRVIRVLFRELAALNRQRSALTVVVHLPTIQDFDLRTSRRWAAELSKSAAAAEIPYIDLRSELRQLSRRALMALYIQPGEVDFHGAAYHYNEKGNRLIAERLYRRLLARPDTRRALGADRSG